MSAEVEGAKAASLAFRIAALALSVAAAVVMGTASNILVVVSGSGHGRVVSYSDYGALTYFVAASAVASVFAALALYWFVHGGGGGSRRVWALDAAAQALLFSASGAALAARGCFVDGAASGAFGSRTGVAAAVGAGAAAAVTLAALTSFSPRGGGGDGDSDGGGGHGCKHGC